MKQSALFIGLALAVGCSTHDDPKSQDQPTLVGNWRHVSYVVSHCTDPGDERNDQCTGTAEVCGVLSLTETTWTWVETLSDGSQYSEGGDYTISGNVIILSGASGPGTKTYSISGSTVNYTQTSLTFTNSSLSTGCTYTVTYAKHLQPFVPFG